MNSVVKFSPKQELEAISQVAEFIEHARHNYMGTIGLDHDAFDAPVWSIDRRIFGEKRSKFSHIKFSKFEVKVARGQIAPIQENLIQTPFNCYLKALFLQRLVDDSTQLLSDMQIVLRSLEYVVRQRLGDLSHPSLITTNDFKLADKTIAALADASAYRRCCLLQTFAKIINEKGLASRHITWKNKHSKPSELRMNIGLEAEIRRQEKMPTQKAIRTLMQLAIWALDGSMYKRIPEVIVEDNSIIRLRAHSDEKDGPVVLGLALCAIGLNCRVIPSSFKQSVFEETLTERDAVEGHKSIFERYGYYEEDGSKIEMTTHEFRHFWHTLLKKAGVSELISAYAAGRADRKQNEAYDLRSPYEAADLSFDIVDANKNKIFEQSALAVAHELLERAINKCNPNVSVISFSPNSIVTFDKENGALNVEGCHISKYGICRHNYVSSGCKKFLDCIDCDQLLCVKGVISFEKNAIAKAESLREHLFQYKKQLIEDVAIGIKDADNWLEKTERQLKKLEALIKQIYLNENVPKGTVVQISADLKNSSSLGRALIEKLGLAMDERDNGLNVNSLFWSEL